MPITKEQLATLRACYDKATPGNWQIRESFHDDAWEVFTDKKTFPVCATIFANHDDLKFIAAVHAVLPELLEALERVLLE